jgi:hypothetical protein
MLYVLNAPAPAVLAWVGLAPSKLYGDEDYRTAYYMGRIGARVVDVGQAFHDFLGYQPLFSGQEHWCRNITRESLAVHKCKTPEMLTPSLDAGSGMSI